MLYASYKGLMNSSKDQLYLNIFEAFMIKKHKPNKIALVDLGAC